MTPKIKSASKASGFLRDRFKERGVTQREIARAFGVPSQVINDLVKGSRRLSFADIAMFELCGIATGEEIFEAEMIFAREEARARMREGGLEAARAELLEEQRAQALRRELAGRGGLRRIPLDVLETILSTLPEKNPARVARAGEMQAEMQARKGPPTAPIPPVAQAEGGES